MSQARQVTLTVGAQLSNSVLNLLTGIALARLLGPAGLGLVSLCTLYVAVVVLGGSLSNSSIIHLAHRDGYSPTKVAFNGIALALVSSVLGWATGTWIFLRLYGASIETAVSSGYFLLFSLAIVVMAVSNTVGYLVLAAGKTGWYNLMAVSQPGGWLTFLAIPALRGDLTVTVALMGFLASHSLRCLVGLLSFRKSWQWQEMRFSWNLLALLARRGMHLYAAGLLSFANFRIDFFLVAYLLGPAQMGIYSIAARVAEQLGLLSSSFSVVILASVARTDRQSFLALVSRAARWCFAGTGLGAVLVVFAGSFLVPWIFGPSYLASVLPLMMLLPGALATSLWRCVGSAHTALGHLGIASLASATALVLMVGLDVLLIPWMGVEGAGAASSVACLVASSIQVLFFLRLSGDRLRNLFLLTRSDLQQGLFSIFRGLRQGRRGTSIES